MQKNLNMLLSKMGLFVEPSFYLSHWGEILLTLLVIFGLWRLSAWRKNVLVTKVANVLNLKSTFKIKRSLGRIEFIGTYQKLSYFLKKKEELQDLFSSRIYQIERVPRFLRSDIIRLNLRNFPTFKNFTPKVVKPFCLWLGNLYSGKMRLPDINEVSSLIICGKSGSGKSQSFIFIHKYYLWCMKKFGYTLKTILINGKGKELDDLADCKLSYNGTTDDMDKIYQMFKQLNEEHKFVVDSGLEQKTYYLILFDEIMDVLDNTKLKDKQHQEAKDRLAGEFTKYLRKTARSSKSPVIAATQNFKVSELSVNWSFFTAKLFSRMDNGSQCSTYGIPPELGLSPDLRRGRFIVGDTQEVVQFPESVKIK